MQAKTREARGLALSRVCVECLCVGCGVWGGGLALAVRVCRFDHDGAAWWMRCSTSTRREAGASRPHARGHGSAGCFLLEGGGWARDGCCLHRWGCVRAFDAPALWRRPKRERGDRARGLYGFMGVSDRVSRLVVWRGPEHISRSGQGNRPSETHLGRRGVRAGQL